MTALTDFEDRPFGCPPDHISRGEARKLMAQQKRQRSKYGVDCSPEGKAERTRQVDGKDVLFDSKAEARRYDELIMLEQQGFIRKLEIQPRFKLEINGRKLGKRGREYRADFSYFESSKRIVEDVKGKETELFKFKKDVMEALFYPLKIKLVKMR